MTRNQELQLRTEAYNQEPMVHNWELVRDDSLQQLVFGFLSKKPRNLILIDGHSGSGKSTFAKKLAGKLGAAVVHTDDIAWYNDIIEWDDDLTQGVIVPWQNGHAVSYRPPGWVKMDRPGSVKAASTPTLIVEGVGAGRQSLANIASLVVWVQSDPLVARTRGIERDMESGERPDRVEAERFWDEWMQTENPFLAAERPWERAGFIVNGTPTINSANGTYISRGPLTNVA